MTDEEDSEEEDIEEAYLNDDDLAINNHMFKAGKRRKDVEQITTAEGEEGYAPQAVTFAEEDVQKKRVAFTNDDDDDAVGSDCDSDYSDKDNDETGAVPTISDQIHVLKRKKTVQRKKITAEDAREHLKKKERNQKLRGSHQGRAKRRANDEAKQAVKDFGY